MALIDIDYFRQQPFGGKSLDSNLPSEVLSETIDEASAYVEDYLDRKILSASYVERILGKRTFTLILDNYPVTALTSVSYVDAYSGAPGTHSTSDFLVHAESGILEKINKLDWFRSDRVYIVTYTAGYATVPGPIKKATALQVAQLLRPAYGGPNEAAEVVPFADDLIVQLLEKYRRKRIS